MFGSTKTKDLKNSALTGKQLALALSHDEKFRKQLAKAVGSGVRARRRAASRLGTAAAVARVTSDKQLRDELQRMSRNLQSAWGRVEKKRSHKLRNTTLIVLVGGGVVAGLYGLRKRAGGSTGIATIDESIEVDVPLATAYNQWTQFEEFPLFMEGVDHVEQLDDTRLHWVATVAGHTAEWDAKILEQKPDKHMSWISEDGKKTRGTVWFKSLGDSKTLLGLSMSYQAEGPLEQAGSAAGLDSRRIRGDLERFKQLIESRGAETGAWRGEVSAGKTDG